MEQKGNSQVIAVENHAGSDLDYACWTLPWILLAVAACLVRLLDLEQIDFVVVLCAGGGAAILQIPFFVVIGKGVFHPSPGRPFVNMIRGIWGDLSPFYSAHNYYRYFTLVAILAFVVGTCLWVLAPAAAPPAPTCACGGGP
jgi:hypothetical protein